MSRRSKIIELALAKSEIMDNNTENHHNNDNVPLIPLEGVASPRFIETGNDLLDFKYNLRQRTPVKVQPQVSVSDETEEIYSPAVSEYLPPQENVPSVLTPDADTESIDDQTKENFDNLEIESLILRDIDLNQEINETIELELDNRTLEEQPTAQEASDVTGSGSQVNSRTLEEQPTAKESSDVTGSGSQTYGAEPSTASEINNTKKKKYPKKTNPGSKRFRNKENWIAETRKRMKNLGEEFINKNGKFIPKKHIKPDCGATCSRKCREAVSEIQRNLIFRDFWALGDHNKQVDYISRFVKRVPKKQIIASTASTSRRKWSFEYYLFAESQEIRTCKTMFVNTLSISDMWLQTLFKKIDKTATGTVRNDRRGSHSTRRNAIPDQVKQYVRDHISQMPTVDSHYVRSRSSKKYLDENLSLPILHKLYLEWMNENHFDQVVATLRQYREIFKTEFNIDFNKPKKDQCPKCDIFKNVSDKTKLEYEQALHIANKNVIRFLKDSDKQRAKHSDSVVAACFDLQKILNTPQSEVSVFYYKRKLATYNFTIYDMGTHVGYCYLWDETIGRKGSNEISSFVFDFINVKVQEGFKEFNFYSDSCGGQNKNKTVFAMYAYASKTLKININHHFFEVGHSQSEGDAMHALIERRKKNKIIYVPQQWIALIKCAKSTGKPYVVKEVNQDMILDYKQLLPYYKKWEYDVNHVKVSWSKIMHIHLVSTLPNVITFQYDSLTDSEMSINLAQDNKTVALRSVKRRATKGPQNNDQELPVNISKAYNAPLPISMAKYKDLISLCNSNAIPTIYHDYFINLPHSSTTLPNIHDESD